MCAGLQISIFHIIKLQNYKFFISTVPIQPYNNWLSKVTLHIIVDIEKVKSQHIDLCITYKLELFEHIGFKLALWPIVITTIYITPHIYIHIYMQLPYIYIYIYRCIYICIYSKGWIGRARWTVVALCTRLFN